MESELVTGMRRMVERFRAGNVGYDPNLERSERRWAVFKLAMAAASGSEVVFALLPT
ncbi:MAG: hypothetical protein JJ863_12335 [Deltaproteobacteria bacterium]|nr:hypothetical protein [Deltaproteobacteria bacterium]